MPTTRGASNNADLIYNAMNNYLFNIKGNSYTLRSFTRTLTEDGYLKTSSISTSTIRGDMQFDTIKEMFDNEGKQIIADGQFYTFSSYTINEEDELIDYQGKKWKIVAKIENEDVEGSKPYSGYAVKRLPATTI